MSNAKDFVQTSRRVWITCSSTGSKRSSKGRVHAPVDLLCSGHRTLDAVRGRGAQIERVHVLQARYIMCKSSNCFQSISIASCILVSVQQINYIICKGKKFGFYSHFTAHTEAASGAGAKYFRGGFSFMIYAGMEEFTCMTRNLFACHIKGKLANLRILLQ